MHLIKQFAELSTRTCASLGNLHERVLVWVIYAYRVTHTYEISLRLALITCTCNLLSSPYMYYTNCVASERYPYLLNVPVKYTHEIHVRKTTPQTLLWASTQTIVLIHKTEVS